MQKGTVKVVTDKGFGFISVDGQEKDVFFHENSLTGDLAIRKLQVGDVVNFEVEETEKGLNATDISLEA
jgi:cold shock protein